MRRITVCVEMMMTFLVMSANVIAWDDLFSTDGAWVAPAGSKSIIADVSYFSAGDTFDADGDKQGLSDDKSGFGVLLRGTYGVIENLNAFVILPFRKWDMGDAGESGISDVWLGAKYAVLEENQLTIRGAINLGTGDDEKSLGNAGGIGLDVALASRIKLGLHDVGGQLGIRYSAEDSDTKWKPGLGVYFEGNVIHQLTNKFTGFVGLEYVMFGDGQTDGTDVDDSGINWLELKVGTWHRINADIGIVGDIRYTVTGKNTGADIGVVIGIGYSL